MITLEPLIAHRGASPYAPENTLAAFDKARALGSRAIEFDVMMSSDGELFIFHDETLKRTTNAKGIFTETPREKIVSLDAGRWFSERFLGEKIPTLFETLRWCVAHGMQANIELKPAPGTAEAMTEAFLTCFHQCWPKSIAMPIVSCFDINVLALCAERAPDIPLGVLFNQWQKNWMQTAQKLRAFSVHLDKLIVTKKRIQSIKERGYKACIYTVNSRKWAQQYFKWGADSILTDYPDLMNV